VNNVIQCAVQEICLNLSNYYGPFDFNLWKLHGIRIIGNQRQIDLTGIIDYKNLLEVLDSPNNSEPRVPVIGEAELDHEEDETKDAKEETQQE
jgi:hypothetical protein